MVHKNSHPAPTYGASYQDDIQMPQSLKLCKSANVSEEYESKADGSAMDSFYGASPPPPAPMASAFAAPTGAALPMAAMAAMPPKLKDVASPTSESKRKSSKEEAMPKARRAPITTPGQAAPPPVQIKAMSLAAGGLIKQSINADPYPASIWDAESTILFNVQLLNSESFMAVTGGALPATPIDAETYQSHGYPFFDIWNEELSGVKGDFGVVKSVGEMDASLAKTKKDGFWEDLTAGGNEILPDKVDEGFKRDEPLKFPVVMLDMSFTRTFKPIKEMEEEAKKLKAAA
jgi:hypothetical protein